MVLKQQYLERVEEAYKVVGRARSIVGLNLVPPFPGSPRGAVLAEDIYTDLNEIEQKLRDLYQIENEIKRP